MNFVQFLIVTLPCAAALIIFAALAVGKGDR